MQREVGLQAFIVSRLGLRNLKFICVESMMQSVMESRTTRKFLHILGMLFIISLANICGLMIWKETFRILWENGQDFKICSEEDQFDSKKPLSLEYDLWSEANGRGINFKSNSWHGRQEKE